MPVEESESAKRKKSIKRFAANVFKDSSVSAVSAIISADSIPRKVFRVSVFLIFMAGFIYQCVQFLSYLLQHPTVINIEVIQPEEFLTPAFTFCNYNKIKRSKFCKKFLDKCMVADEEFCDEYPFYCSGNTTLMPKEEYLSDENADMEFTLDLGHELKDLFHSIRVERENATGPYLRERTRTQDGISECFSLHARSDSPLEPLYTKSASTSWNDAHFEFVFNPEENEMFSPNAKPGVLFLIHSPFIAVSPFRNGMFLKAGYLYKITLNMEEEVLLKSPYKTDCMNYTEIWVKNNRTGPRAQEMCQQRCKMQYYHSLHNCSPPQVLYRLPNVKLCDLEKEYETEKEESLKAATELSSCDAKCKDDCYTVKYIKDFQETYIVPKWKKNVTKNSKPRLTIVRIYFDDSEILSLRYKEQYQEVEVFSYIGGFVGIWLGVSLVQVADVFESLFRILRYIFKKSITVCKQKKTEPLDTSIP